MYWVAALLLSATPSLAAESSGTEAAIRLLVTEVHQMRLALQQSLSLQFTLELIKHQRTLITGVQQQIEFAKDEVETNAKQRLDFEEAARELEARITLEPNNRDQIRGELLLTKKSLEQAKYQETKQKDRVLAGQATLAVEENRLSDLMKNTDAQLGDLRQ